MSSMAPPRCRLLRHRFLPLCLALGLACLAGSLGRLALLPRTEPSALSKSTVANDNLTMMSNAIQRQRERHQPRQPDEVLIKRLFPKFLHVAQKHAGPHRDRAVVMMARHLPDIDTHSWRVHSPAGRNFTVLELQLAALHNLTDGFEVPNIAHYVLPFRDTQLKFHHMVCLLSCLHLMRPDRLVLWYAPGRVPSGDWWRRLRQNVSAADWESRVVMISRQPPSRIYSVPVHHQEHQSDVMRLEALLTFGGVYLDLDVMVLKPLEPLRRSTCTIGREIHYGLCNGAILSAPAATFLAMWHTAYQVFNDAVWAEHSVWLPNSLQAVFPGQCQD